MKKSFLPKTPRLQSLEHRLKTAKDPDGHPVALLDELMVFLEDPPPGTTDRWQAAADLCAQYGVATSRMAVWRLYRANVLSWRRTQTPGPDEATARMLEQARQLVAQRALDSLLDPHLPPAILVGLARNENRRQEILLARAKFDNQLKTRTAPEHQQYLDRVEAKAQARALFRFPPSIPGHTT